MPKQQSFEEQVIADRQQFEREYRAAVGSEFGPLPYSKTLSEDQQDELWAKTAPQYRDPQAFLMLLAPKEQGGAGLTPLAASLEKYPERRRLYEAAGASIDDHIKYAETRKKRIAEKQQMPAEPPMQEGA